MAGCRIALMVIFAIILLIVLSGCKTADETPTFEYVFSPYKTDIYTIE